MSSEFSVAVVMLACGLVACAGTLEDPERFAEAGGLAPSSADAGPVAACPPVETGIFQVKCATAGCHAASGPAGGLDLASPDVLGRLANKSAQGGPGSIVVPGNPGASVLYTKLTSAPPFGSRMPLGATLDDATLACVHDWIAASR